MVDPVHEFADFCEGLAYQTHEGVHCHIALERPKRGHPEAGIARVPKPLLRSGSIREEVDRSSRREVCVVMSVHIADQGWRCEGDFLKKLPK
jgi:hypothetical protein